MGNFRLKTAVGFYSITFIGAFLLFGAGTGLASEGLPKICDSLLDSFTIDNACGGVTVRDPRTGNEVAIEKRLNDLLDSAQIACLNALTVAIKHENLARFSVASGSDAGCENVIAKEVYEAVSKIIADSDYLTQLKNKKFIALTPIEVIREIGKVQDTFVELRKIAGSEENKKSACFKSVDAVLASALKPLEFASDEMKQTRLAALNRANKAYANVDYMGGEAWMTDSQARAYVARIAASQDPAEKKSGETLSSLLAPNPHGKGSADHKRFEAERVGRIKNLQKVIHKYHEDGLLPGPFLVDGIIAKRTISDFRRLMEERPQEFVARLKESGFELLIPSRTPGGMASKDETSVATGYLPNKRERDPRWLEALEKYQAHERWQPEFLDISPDGKVVYCVQTSSSGAGSKMGSYEVSKLPKGWHCGLTAEPASAEPSKDNQAQPYKPQLRNYSTDWEIAKNRFHPFENDNKPWIRQSAFFDISPDRKTVYCVKYYHNWSSWMPKSQILAYEIAKLNDRWTCGNASENDGVGVETKIK